MQLLVATSSTGTISQTPAMVDIALELILLSNLQVLKPPETSLWETMLRRGAVGTDADGGDMDLDVGEND